MDTLESQIYELEERIIFLENQAEHNSTYFKETLGSLATRISNLEDQTSVKDKCDQTYVDGMIRNIADIFQDNIEEIFSKMDDFEVKLESLHFNNVYDQENPKSQSPELSKSAYPQTKSEVQEEQSFEETKSELISTSTQTDFMEEVDENILILEDDLLNQCMTLGKCIAISESADNIHTLKHIDHEIIPNIKKQCVDMQKSLNEYSKFDTASASINKHIAEAIYAAEVWIFSMNEQIPKKLINSSAASTSSRSPKPVCNIQFPCVLNGHQHSIAECKEFFLQSPQKRVTNKKSFDFKYCTVCLQSNSSCRFRRCSNLKFLPQILVCRECKHFSRTEGTGYYSVFYCLNKNHTKPSNSDILKALFYYLPDSSKDSSWISAPKGVEFKWHDSNSNCRQQRAMNRKYSQDKLSMYSNSNRSYISSHGQSHPYVKEVELEFSNHRHKIPQELDKGVSQFWNNLRNMENG